MTDLIPITGSANAALLSAVLQLRVDRLFPITAEFPIPPLESAQISDKGANVKSARNMSHRHDSEDCLNHDIASLVGDVLDDVPGTHHMFCKKMAKDMLTLSNFNSWLIASPERTAMFDDFLDPSVQARVPLRERTQRWEGRFRMVERTLTHKAALQKFCLPGSDILEDFVSSQGNSAPADFLHEGFFVRVAGYKSLLEPLHILSKRVQSKTVVLISCIISHIVEVIESFNPSARDTNWLASARAKFALAAEFRLRSRISFVNNTTMASVLDPSNEGLERWISKELIDECWEAIGVEALEMVPRVVGEEDLIESGLKVELTRCRRRIEALWIEGSKMGVIEFFKANDRDFPLLCPYIRALLCVPVSASACDSGFAASSMTVTKHRNLTSVSIVEALAIVSDMTYQPNYSFEVVKLGIAGLARAEAIEEFERDAARDAAEAARPVVAEMSDDGDLGSYHSNSSSSLNDSSE